MSRTPGDDGLGPEDLSQRGDKPSDADSSRANSARLGAGQEFSLPRLNAQRERDITADFEAATSKLDVGDLVKDEYFTLYESIGALEVMDSKMDSGYLEPNEKPEDDFDVMQSLSPRNIIGITDDLLCSETAWQKGHPLSQTVFTSLYVDKLLWPDPITLDDASFGLDPAGAGSDFLVHVVLRAYCLALIKSCDCVHQLIVKETYYEEEDFVSNLYNRSLLSKFSTEEVCSLLQGAIDVVQTKPVESEELRKAILSRLNLRLSFLEAVAIDVNHATSIARDHWQKCLDYFQQVETTHALGESIPESFSAKVQRKLASTVPPRPIVQSSFEDSISFLANLCKNTKEACNAIECTRTSSSINFIRVFMSQKPQPCVYTRCVLQALTLRRLGERKRGQLRDFCFDDLSEVTLPSHVLLDPTNRKVEHPEDDRFQIASKMDQFVTLACDPFLDVIRALCMNRARSRRMLCNLLIEWDNVQLDLEEVDNDLQAYTHEQPLKGEVYELPLSSWAYYYKLKQMQWIVQLGFELNIYHVDEWAGMYRYLQEISEFLHKHIERMFAFIDHHSKASGRLDEARRKAFDHSMSFLAIAGEEVAATALFAESLASLYMALGLMSLLPHPPPRPYSSTELRRTLRLRPFLTLCLPSLHSPEAPFKSVERLAHTIRVPPSYSKHPAKHGKALALIDYADQLMRQARKAWDNVSKATAESAACMGCEEQWRRGIREIVRATVVAGVTGTRVRKWILEGAKDAALAIQLDNGVLDEDARAGLAAPWIVPEVKAT